MEAASRPGRSMGPARPGQRQMQEAMSTWHSASDLTHRLEHLGQVLKYGKSISLSLLAVVNKVILLSLGQIK
jgi:hypothetical protein